MRLSSLFEEPPTANAPAAPVEANAPGNPSLVAPARIAHWRGSSRRGDTGLEALDGYAAFAMYEVSAIPDFSSPRFPDLAGLDATQRVQRVGQLQAEWLAALHGLGPRFGFTLRYVCRSGGGTEARIRLFVIGRSFGFTRSEACYGLSLLKDGMARSFPSVYRLHDWQGKDPGLTDAVLKLDGMKSLVELLKPEACPRAWHDPGLCGFDFLYYPLPLQAAENDMTGVCRALREQGEAGSAVVDICAVPTGSLTDVERQELGGWSGLCEQWGREQKIKRAGGLYSPAQTIEVAPDPNASEARKAYQDLLGRYGSPGMRAFLYGVRVLWEQPMPPVALASALASHALSPGSAPQMQMVGEGHAAWERALAAARFCGVSPAVCNAGIWQQRDAPETLRRLHRMADTRELSGFFRLPIAGREGCPGMDIDGGLPQAGGMQEKAAAQGGRAGIRIGRFVEGTRVTREEALFAPNDLSKHGLIVGTPGSGKTSLCFSLLTQLWEEQGIPFLVLEPAKTEYRALQMLPCFSKDLLVFTVGNERVAPLRFNPLDIQEGVSVAEHIATLNTCFAGAFSLFDPLPMLLDTALRRCYEDKGFSEYGVGGEEPGLEPPTLADLYRAALAVAEGSGYQGEIKGNIRGALETRLGALLRGPKGRCFNTRRSVPLSLLFGQPVVLELEALNDEEKALVMMFLLAAIRAHARATRKSGAKLAHVMLVEEAHNVIGRSEGKGGGNTANPQEVSVRFFTRMLAEMRAMGEGMLIADQLPTAIAPEAIKSTNLKVMHRVVAADDRQELGQAMTLDAGQLQQAATLPPGHSLVFQEGWERSRHVVEPDFKALHRVEEPPEDGAVRQRMEVFTSEEGVWQAYLPFALCGAVCTRCDGRVREEAERWASRKRPLIAEAKRMHPQEDPALVAFEEYVDGLEPGPEERVRWHCASVHFQEMVLPAVAPTDRGARTSR